VYRLLNAVVGCAALPVSADNSQFEVTPVRNVSTPAFPVTDQPGSPQQQQQLARTSEVENIPQQLSVRPTQDSLLTYHRCASHVVI